MLWLDSSEQTYIGVFTMINNIATISTHTFSMLKALDEAPFEFFPTGSRFFGGANATSDYDFFAEDTPEIRAFLEGQCFSVDNKAYEEDSLVVTVYRTDPGYYSTEQQNPDMVVPGFEGFDIQLVKNVEAKLLVQRILKDRYRHGIPGTKFEKSTIWNDTLHTLEFLAVVPS